MSARAYGKAADSAMVADLPLPFDADDSAMAISPRCCHALYLPPARCCATLRDYLFDIFFFRCFAIFITRAYADAR